MSLLCRLAVFVAGAAVGLASAAETTYELRRCVQFKDGVALRFSGSRREVRRMFLSPRGVELSGDIKGEAPLAKVKGLTFEPVLKISYASGDVVSFGPIDAPCQKLMREVAGPLISKAKVTQDPGK